MRTLKPFDPTSYAAFKAAHGHIFANVYDWAGQERTYTTGRGAATFARAEFIRSEMDKRFAAIAGDAALRVHDRDGFARAAALHIGEINAVHPFLEGNGRMQRVLLQQLAPGAGFVFKITGIDQAAWYAAAEASFQRQDYAPLTTIIAAHLSDPPANPRPRTAPKTGPS